MSKHIFSIEKKYVVETNQGTTSSFDAVGSQQILEAFDRKETAKPVRQKLVPCLHFYGLHCLCCCLHEGGVCACVRVFREAGCEGEAGNIQCR